MRHIIKNLTRDQAELLVSAVSDGKLDQFSVRIALLRPSEKITIPPRLLEEKDPSNTDDYLIELGHFLLGMTSPEIRTKLSQAENVMRRHHIALYGFWCEFRVELEQSRRGNTLRHGDDLKGTPIVHPVASTDFWVSLGDRYKIDPRRAKKNVARALRKLIEIGRRISEEAGSND